MDADWLIGNDYLLPDVKGVALRSMKAPGTAYKHPQLGKDPQPMLMDDYVNLPNTAEGDYGGVHINSGIPNHAFYLAATGMAEAGFSEYAWQMAGSIWYDSLEHGDMTPRCSFEQFAKITCDVARTKYGDQAATVVKAAWTKVGVLNSASPPTQRPKTEGLLETLKDSEGALVELV
jgi:Zn-dependent metalloprotease